MNKIKTLKKNYEFKRVLKSSNFIVGKQVIVYICKNKKEENYIGIGINTKLCNAVKRNRLKRLIRENYRSVKDDLKKGYNIVFIWNKKVIPENADFHIINKDIINAFKEAKLL